jgi:quercetin dioxygenase-like cupin family protein
MHTELLFTETAENEIVIPAIGVNLQVRIAPAATQGRATLIETTDAPGYGPPMHRHERETEVFHIVKGRYLFEVDGKRTIAEAGTTVFAKVGSTHRFSNIDAEPAQMLILIMPGLDAAAFFTELGNVMESGIPAPETLQKFGDKWGVEFLGPPLAQSENQASNVQKGL